jgi:hypothetical protein
MSTSNDLNSLSKYSMNGINYLFIENIIAPFIIIALSYVLVLVTQFLDKKVIKLSRFKNFINLGLTI